MEERRGAEQDYKDDEIIAGTQVEDLTRSETLIPPPTYNTRYTIHGRIVVITIID